MDLCPAELLQRVLDNESVIMDKQSFIMDSQSFITDIVCAGLKHAFKPPSTGKALLGSNKEFRDRIVKFYGMGKRVRHHCTCLGVPKPLHSAWPDPPPILEYGMCNRPCSYNHMQPTCMVLGKALPSEFLVAGHLYAVRWKVGVGWGASPRVGPCFLPGNQGLSPLDSYPHPGPHPVRGVPNGVDKLSTMQQWHECT